MGVKWVWRIPMGVCIWRNGGWSLQTIVLPEFSMRWSATIQRSSNMYPLKVHGLSRTRHTGFYPSVMHALYPDIIAQHVPAMPVSPKSPQDTHEFGLHHLSVSSLSKDMTNAGTTSLFNRKPLVKGHPSMIDHQFLSGFILPPTSKFRSEIIRRATYYSYSTWSEAKPYLQTDLGYSPETSPLVNNFLRSVSLLERLYLVTEIHSRSSS